MIDHIVKSDSSDPRVDTHPFFTDEKHKRLYEKFLEALSEKLNQVHAIDWDRSEWESILGIWLSSTLAVCFDRFNLWCDEYSIRQIEQYEWASFFFKRTKIPRTLLDARDYFIDDSWNRALFEDLRPSNVHSDRQKSELSILVFPARPNGFLFRSLIITLRNVLTSRSIDKLILFYDFPFSLSDLFLLKLDRRIHIVAPHKVTLPKICVHLRDRLWGPGWCDADTPFEKFCEIFIAQLMPISVLEEFDLYQKQAFRIPKSEFLIAFHSQFYDDLYKHVSVLTKQRSSLILHIQHGGGAWESLNMPYEIDRKSCDKYLVPGVETYRDPRCIPYGLWKNPRVEARNSSVIDVLFIIQSFPTYLFDSRVGPIGSKIFSYYRTIEGVVCSIAREIGSTIDLKVRLPSSDYGHALQERFGSIHGVGLDKNLSYHQSCQNTGVVVCTYLGTTFYEALALNVPVILLMDDAWYAVDEICDQDFLELEIAKILVRSPMELIVRILEVYENPDLWWSDSAVQQTRKRFCLKYARQLDRPLAYLINIVTEIDSKRKENG